MSDPLPLTLFDGALRGTLVALLMLLAAVLRRDRPRLPAARAGVALTLGLCVQVVGSTPLFEALVPRLWQAPLVAVSAGNAVLFWVFVQALFDGDFALRPLHGAAWLSVAVLSGLNCAVSANSDSAVALVTGGLQRGVPLLFAGLAAVAAVSHWRSDLLEERRRLRAFIVVSGIAYSLATLAARLGSPQGRLLGSAATLDAAALLVIVAVAAWRMLCPAPIFSRPRVSPFNRCDLPTKLRPRAIDSSRRPRSNRCCHRPTLPRNASPPRCSV